ncbi:MAG: hypothetical protein ACOYM5_02900 [Caulobacter sp.]
MTLAPAPHPGGRPALDAQVLAVQNADILATLAGVQIGPADIAAATGRDPSNLRKTLDRLRREGLIHYAPGGPAILTRLGDDLRKRTLLLDGGAALEDPDAVALSVDQLTPDAANPRRRSGFSPAEILDMAVSLRAEYDATGKPFITPPTVYPADATDQLHRIAKGERRWRGWAEAVRQGWIPDDLAVTCPIYRGDATQALASTIVENLQRADLDPLEEAEAFAALADQLASSFTSPVPEICRQIGKSGDSGERYVQERLRVARTATPQAKDAFIETRRRAAEGEPDAEPFLWKHLPDSVKVPRQVTLPPAPDLPDEDEDILAFLRRLSSGPAASTHNGQTYPNPTLAAEARRRAEHQGGASSPARTVRTDDTNTPTQADAPSSPGDSATPPAESDGEAEERPASPSPHAATPQAGDRIVREMRAALADLWVAAGAALRAIRDLEDGDAFDNPTPAQDRAVAILTAAANALQPAAMAAAQYVPPERRAAATQEHADHG